jgi:hypothetical protein
MQHWNSGASAPLRDRHRGVAVLVDGDNIPQTAADEIYRRAEALGPLVALRCFCERSNPNGWNNDHRFSVSYVDGLSGKNSVDIRLVIAAIDLAHSGPVDAFVLVSGDNDFGPLAHRLRSPGFYVMGMGRAEAGLRFQLACSEFHFIEKAKPCRTIDAAPSTHVAKPTEAQKQKPKLPPASKFDAAIAALIVTHGINGRLKLTTLNGGMRQKTGMNISTQPEKTWRRYLDLRPHLYKLDPRGPEACVALAPVGR